MGFDQEVQFSQGNLPTSQSHIHKCQHFTFRDPNGVSSTGGEGGGGAWPRYSATSGRKYLNFRPDRTVAVVSAAPGARSSCAFWNSLVPQMEAAAKKTCQEQQLLRIAEESKFRPLRKR